MLSDRCLSVCDVGVLWPNSWMDQDETWHGGRPWPRPYCVRWGPSFPSPSKGTAASQLLAHLLWSNGRFDQDATWYEHRPRPRPHCVRWGPSCPTEWLTPNFRPCLLWPNGCPSELLLSSCFSVLFPDWSSVCIALYCVVLCTLHLCY